MLRAQLRRFVDEEVKPHAARWEEDGMVPREILRRMGGLGVLGVRYPESYGGAGMDSRGSLVLAEEVGRSTFGGFASTVLVHTDMASPMPAARPRSRAGCRTSSLAGASAPWR